MIPALLALATSGYMIVTPYQPHLVAKYPPGDDLGFALVYLIIFGVIGAFLLPRGTRTFSLIAMVGTAVAAIGALFSPHPIYAPVFLVHTGVFFIASFTSSRRLVALSRR